MRRPLVLFLLLLAAAVCNAQEALRVGEVDDYLTRMEAFGFSGGVVIAEKGKIVLEKGYGFADRERDVRITPDTLFDIGSITKTYTATGILQFVEAGKMSLDDTLPRFFKDVPEEKRGITIAQLLTHTAGLPLYSGGDFDLATREQMVEATLEPKLRFPPGSKWEYCNTCYQLLTVIVEDVSGQPYEKFIYDRYLAPNGIRDTGYVIPDFLGRPVANGYRGTKSDGSPLQKAWYGDGPSWNLRGAGGFIAPLRDLVKWDRVVRATPESIRKRSTEPVVATGRRDEKMAYGWFYRDTPQGRLISHSGGNGFFGVNLRRYVDRDVVVVFGTNNARYDFAPHEGEVAARLFGTSKAAMPPAAKMSSGALLKHAGRYKLASGDAFELRADRNQLVLDPASVAVILPLLGRHPKALDTPRAREAETLARELTTAVGRKDYSLLVKHAVPDVKAEEEVQFYTDWIKGNEEQLGPFVSATPLWTIEEGDQLHTYVAMRFQRGVQVLVSQQRPKGIYLHAGRPVTPEVYRFVAQSPTELVTWNPYLEAAGTLRIDGNAVVLGGQRATRLP